MKKINLEQFPFELAFEGYCWYSNASKPRVFNNEILTKELFTSLPFIVEGNLYSEETGISINIKNIDGDYLITQAQIKDLDLESKEYLAHRLEGVGKIKLVHHWEEEEPDDLLEGMTTLVPVWMAFKGFVNK